VYTGTGLFGGVIMRSFLFLLALLLQAGCSSSPTGTNSDRPPDPRVEWGMATCRLSSYVNIPAGATRDSSMWTAVLQTSTGPLTASKEVALSNRRTVPWREALVQVSGTLSSTSAGNSLEASLYFESSGWSSYADATVTLEAPFSVADAPVEACITLNDGPLESFGTLDGGHSRIYVAILPSANPETPIIDTDSFMHSGKAVVPVTIQPGSYVLHFERALDLWGSNEGDAILSLPLTLKIEGLGQW